ncbi:origin recognition complex subunit 3 isoform X2 [Diachasma alloeum]|uniref:origin recognition complex subunit 3 isoform X2 n=1 Tax=Diachasma alloeum TaxID=454923 RepID=UPI00073819C2|nr:origin recognition complex subunit 3 isoform X2 [Diachasma alloeum]
MDNVSVSKGIFAYKGSYKIGQKKRNIRDDAPVDEPWYQAYTEAWSIIKNAAEEINVNMFKQILSDLQCYVSDVNDTTEENFLGEIATAILLTGVNLPDHEVLFGKLAAKISTVTEHIAVIQSRDSGNMKNLTEETVFQLINGSNENGRPEVRKNQCTFRVLESWYQEKHNEAPPLVVIIPDFESFNPIILRDFILVLSSYSSSIKFILIFGVATTLHAVHRSLSYDVTSKLRVKVFHTQTQMKSLSDVLEGTVLSGKTSFMLTGRAFQLLTDIFLFYDFSVHGFLQGYKLCMIQHFYGNNLTTLCCNPRDIDERLNNLNEEDISELRKLPSVVKYIEKSKRDKQPQMQVDEFKNIIGKLLREFHDAMRGFFTILKCLHSLAHSLPGAPLGKQEYKESLQLLGFLSKNELLGKMRDILGIIEKAEGEGLAEVHKNLERHLEIIENASLEVQESSETVNMSDKLSRQQFKEKLLKMSQQQSRSPYKQAQIDLMEYLDHDVFAVYLVNPNRLATSEIFCFSDANAAKHHLRGSLRAAVHTGLNDPQIYLNCGCCKLENEETIQQTLPDTSIIYKLHLESRKLINMYDWLQAFLTIVNPNDDTEEQREIDPKMQARFTRAVAELQFLGFIKSSRRKTDHVKRLT